MKNIIFLTENVNKYKELSAFLDSIPELNGLVTITMVKPDYELHEIQSMNRSDIIRNKLATTMSHNAHFLQIETNTECNTECNTETWVMVEDTSLCIDKQGGFPGPFIKYYLQCIPLNQIANSNWGSAAQSIVNLAIGRLGENGNITISKDFEGLVQGNIVESKGNNGFGFDPIFRPVGSNLTNAQMTMEEKALYNPRTRAFEHILKFLLPQA
jgi:non-canonical purine NTP pyrophosphatase (RdgB/HAM1 family)